MTEKHFEPVSSIRSVNSHHLDLEDHEVDLHAIASVPHSLNEIAVEFTSEQKFFILRRLNYEGLVSLDNLPVGAAFMLEKIQALPQQEALEILREYLVVHDNDVNIPPQEYEFVEKLVDTAPLYSDSASGDIRGRLDNSFAPQSELGVVNSTLNESSENNFKGNDGDSSELRNSEHPPVHEKTRERVTAKSLNSLEAHERPIFELFDWDLQARLEAALIAYHSPYPEIRSITDPYDDPNMPVETFRSYLLALIWVVIITFVNQFFSERFPGISLSTSVVQLFLYPCGKFLELVLPKWSFKIWRYTIDLNPGPWNGKEQMLATLAVSVTAQVSYVSWNIHVQKLKIFYGNTWVTFGYQVLLILSSNFMGFGFAGILRAFCVYPVNSIWPSILPTIALNRALLKPEKKENINGWTISRYYFFFSVTAFSFLYFWIPDYLFAALSTFNWMTWIKPDNFNLASITGSASGLGLNPIPSFDWNVINYNACLTIPFYSYANQYIGMIIGFFCIVGVYWNNHYWSSYLPINSNALFTNTGESYSVQEVVNSNSLFDFDKYKTYGPPFYTAANLVVYGSFFAIYPFGIVYEIGVRYKQIYKGFASIFRSFTHLKSSNFANFHDPHSRMMSRYKEVPDWCFLVVLVIAVVLAIICVEIYPAETPVWGIFFALGINFVFLIPLTALYSITGFSFGLNVLVELIVGYAIPGNGLALNFIKAIGYNIDGQAQTYISDQKMGHYSKIPQRAMFRVQMLAVFIYSFVGLGVMNLTFTHIKGYCEPDQPQKFSCPDARTFYSASVIWGVIGPRRSFSLYPELKYCFLIGFLLALVALAFRYTAPKRYIRYFQPTLIIGGFLNYAPYNLSYFTGGLYLSIASMYYLRKYYTTWWEKYNYVFSGAMDAGVAFSSVIIFFAVQYHDKSITWWGNTVSYAGLDGAGISRLNATELAPDGYFGPRMGHYP